MYYPIVYPLQFSSVLKSHEVSFHVILCFIIMSYFFVFYHYIVLFCILLLYHVILYFIIYYFVFYCIILFCILLLYIILYFIIGWLREFILMGSNWWNGPQRKWAPIRVFGQVPYLNYLQWTLRNIWNTFYVRTYPPITTWLRHWDPSLFIVYFSLSSTSSKLFLLLQFSRVVYVIYELRLFRVRFSWVLAIILRLWQNILILLRKNMQTLNCTLRQVY